jgi:hypothetical protein
VLATSCECLQMLGTSQTAQAKTHSLTPVASSRTVGHLRPVPGGSGHLLRNLVRRGETMTDNTAKESVEQREARLRQADLRVRESSPQTRQESINKLRSFDLRTEVSADAPYIVKNLWIISCCCP